MANTLETLVLVGAVVVAAIALLTRSAARPVTAILGPGGMMEPTLEQTRQRSQTSVSPLQTNVSTDPADVGSYTPTGDGLVATTADTLQTDSGILGTGGGAASSPYGSDL